MRLSISIIVLVTLYRVFAIPLPGPGRKPGDIVRIKPKDVKPMHPMGGSAASLNNNHHGIVLGEENGRLRVSHVSSNPPPPRIHVHSVVGSVDLHGKIHVGPAAVDPAHVKDSNKFPGQRLTPDEVSKINLAGDMRRAAHEAAKHRMAFKSS